MTPFPNDANCPGSETCDAGAGCQSIVSVFACAKNAPAQVDACAAGNDPGCSTAGESCGRGGKICHEYSCVTEPSGPTNPPAPTNPPVAAPTNPPGSCAGQGMNCDSVAAAGDTCCNGCEESGKPSRRACL